jgi:uncharacterized Ntn-hydrolase superfamily protein
VTYSIVARDPETGQLGVAVASRVLAIGALCPWIEAGVGVVATQAFVEVTYGPRTLSALRQGATPTGALEELIVADPQAATRQIAVVDGIGRVAVYDGEECLPEAGHVTGGQFSCQANMMRNSGVPETMAEAFVATEGPLVVRLLSALDAAEAAGGDFRGRQSSAVKVVSGRPEGRMGGMLIDLRVDDHPEPLVELRRLTELLRTSGWFGKDTANR